VIVYFHIARFAWHGSDISALGQRLQSSPPETDPPLAVYPNAVLAFPVAAKRFEAIGRRMAQIVESRGCLQLGQGLGRRASALLEFSNAFAGEKVRGLPITAGPYRHRRLLCVTERIAVKENLRRAPPVHLLPDVLAMACHALGAFV